MTQTTTLIQKINKRDKGKIIWHYKLLRLLVSQKIILFLFFLQKHNFRNEIIRQSS